MVYWYVLICSFLSVKKRDILGMRNFHKLEKGEERPIEALHVRVHLL